MNINSPDLQLRSYLLGRLDEGEEEKVEQRLLADGDFLDELDMVENELIDEYVHRRLSDEERELFESHRLQTPQQKQKLAFATALDEATAERATAQAKVVTLAERAPKRNLFSAAYMKIAAVVIVAVGLALVLWFWLGRKSDVDRGMLALNQAYKNQRLVESRISDMNHSELRQLRGGESPNIDALARRHAELLFSEAVRTRGDASSYHALGRSYLAEGKFELAQQQFEQALKLDPENAEIHSDLAAALLEMGRAQRQNDEGKAAANFGKALEHIKRALDLDPSVLEAQFNRGLLLEQLKLDSQAKEAWQAYLQKDSTSGWADEARAHLQFIQEKDQKSSANRSNLYQQFLSAYSKEDREGGWAAMAQSRSRMGNKIVERLVNEYLDRPTITNTAIDSSPYLSMLKFAGEVEAQRSGDLYTTDLATFYSGTTAQERTKLAHARRLVVDGLKSYDRSEFDKAIQFYSDASREFSALGNNCERLFTESWVGYSVLRRDGFVAAERFERLAEAYEQKRYRSLEAQAIAALSDAWTDKNEFSKVLELANRAMEIADDIDDDSTKLRCLQEFVSINMKLGKYVESLGYGLTAIQLSQSFLDEPKLIWPFYNDVALDFQLLHLPNAALQFQTYALEIAKQSAWPFIIARSYTQLGIIQEQQGDFTSAIRNGLQALAEGGKVEEEESRLAITSQATARLGHVYRQAGDFQNALAQYDLALQMFEKQKLAVFEYETRKGRFLTLLRMNEISGADEELSKALMLFEQYRNKIQEERNRNSFFDVGQDIYDLAIDFAQTNLNDPIRAFDYAEQSRARSLLGYLKAAPKLVETKEGADLQHTSVSPAVRFSSIRERLPQGVQIVEYSLGDDKLFVWVVSRTGINSVVVPTSKEQLDGTIKGFVSDLSGGSVNRSTSRELYAILIEPIEPLLDNSKQLCIVADKTLVQLPFAALVSPADDKFFVEKFVFEFAPSTNVFVACTESARSKPHVEAERALTVGNPNFSTASFPDLPSLPSAAREAREVATYYDSQPLIGSDARESRVKAAMANAEVIHLASHFIVDYQSPMRSKLLLSKGNDDRSSEGVLEVSEVYAMNLPRSRLVVLSACQTGIGRTYRGEGALSIARSFISAGVPLVVATLWPVESETTAELMVRFHQYRALKGFPTVEALRKAQLDMLKSVDKTRSSPSAWASFFTVGGYAAF